jgi:RHS repeat-associated protein
VRDLRRSFSTKLWTGLLAMAAYFIASLAGATVPGAVTAIQVPSPLVHASFTMTWTAPATGGTATRYEVEREQDGATWVPLSTSIQASSYSHTESLQTGSYRFRVRACNPDGCGSYVATNATQAAGPVLVSGDVNCAPDGYCVKLRAQNVTVPAGLYTYVDVRRLNYSGQVTINQGAGLTTGSDAQGQFLQFSVPNALRSDFATVGLLFYAANHGQLMFSNPLTLQGLPFINLPPNAPTNLQHPGTIVHAQFPLSWSAPTGAGPVTRYEVERQRDGVWSVLSSNHISTTYSHGESLQTGPYKFRVRACNSNGCSSYATSPTVQAAGPVLLSGNVTCSATGYCVRLYGTNMVTPSSLYTYAAMRKLDDSSPTVVNFGAGLVSGSDAAGQYIQFEVPAAMQAAFTGSGIKFFIVNHGQLIFSVPLVFKKAPTLSIAASPNASLVAPAATSLTSTVSDTTGLTSLVFQQTNGTHVCTGSVVTAGTYGCNWSSIAAGTYTIRARATIGGVTYDSPTLSMTVNSAPSAAVTISAVPNTGLTAPAATTLSSTVTPSAGVTSVQFQHTNGTSICNGVLSAGVYSCNWTLIPAGTYSVRARATVSGQNFDSSVLTINVSTPGATETLYFHHANQQGSVVSTTSTTGAIVSRQHFIPFGIAAARAGTPVTNLGFTGKRYDSVLGLNYFGARYYDPQISRFLSIDPADFSSDDLQTFGRYHYSNNNPLAFVDPDGRRSRDLEQIYRESGATAPPKSPDDWLGPTIGVGLGVMFAPVVAVAGAEVIAVAVYSAPMATTRAFLFVTDIIAGDAVGGTALAVSGPSLVMKAADAALAAGKTTGAASELGILGREYVSVSGVPNRLLHPEVEEALSMVPPHLRPGWHGHCAELGCISDALYAGEDVRGGIMRSINIGTSGGNKGHGTPKPACWSCSWIQSYFGIKHADDVWGD